MQLNEELRHEVTPKNILMIARPVSVKLKSPVVWLSWRMRVHQS